MANAKTHLTFGIVTAMVLNLLKQIYFKEKEEPINYCELCVAGFVGALGGLLPDILEPATSPCHRQFFHSWFFAIIIVLAMLKVRPTVLVSSFLILGVASYFSHLALDSFTRKSLPIFGRI